MHATIHLLTGKFPEPAFSILQRAVFSHLELESPALAAVFAHESHAPAVPHEPFQPAMVRFGAYIREELVGWSCGWLERNNSFYMANSGVAPDHRGKGIYAALLQAVVLHAHDLGAPVVRSQHSVLNNRVIVCKLKRGFHIAGLSVSAQMGCLVELVRHVSEPRLALFQTRTIPFAVPR